MPTAPQSLVQVLRRHATEIPDASACTFLANGCVEAERLTYRELDVRARAVAVELRRWVAPGDRALLLYPPGLEFIAALLGCFYAGVVAVPAYPPRPHRANSRLRSIVGESRPAVALTTLATVARAEALALEVPELRQLRFCATETLAVDLAETWAAPSLAHDAAAFLQYTSGSTSDPKGVVVGHDNLLHNQRVIAELCGHSAATIFVGWLPLYHDMGLVGNVLQPLYLGGRCILMAPSAFLQSPVRWLAAISRYRATTSGGPNFAYDLCVRRIDAEQRAGLDLGSWSVAFNGAEPIRAETLERFAATFAGCGFRRQVFFPCYGLAEATLLVTGGARRQEPVTLAVQSEPLRRHRVVAARPGAPGSCLLVSSGRTGRDQSVRIVDPESRLPAPAGAVGEIWVAGPNVARGYWNRPPETAAVFHATTAGGSRPFLRTGDLGFVRDGELFVTGRRKELVIVRGQNHYPQDIERTAERSHPALLPGAAAAFAVEQEGVERLVVVLERGPRSREGIDSVAPAVRRAVAAEHQIEVHAVVLVRAGTVPKTTSGKIRRGACRELYVAGGLEALGTSVLGGSRDDWTGEAPTREALLALDPDRRRAALTAFLADELGRILRCDLAAGDLGRPLGACGLDSLAAFELGNALEQALEIPMPLPEGLYQASIEELSNQLAERLSAEACPPMPAAALPRLLPLPPAAAAEAPLSAMQKALWFEQQLDPESAAYNVAFAARLVGEVDLGALRRAGEALIERHAVLRATVVLRHGEPVQRSGEAGGTVPAPREVASDDGRGLAAAIAAEAHRPFDLERGPLFRMTLLVCPPAERVLLIVAHHLVIDGWSLWVLLDELRILYTAAVAGQPADLAPPAPGHGEFVRWQTELLAGSMGEGLWRFWRDALAGEMALDLPYDRQPSPGRSHRGAAHPMRLDRELVRQLNALAVEAGTTLYAVLLAAYAVLLSRYAGRQEVLVGVPVAARSRPELRGVVGCLFNTLPLRCDLGGDPTFRALLHRLRGRLAAALQHQDYPSHRLAEQLQPGRRASGLPFFEAQLIFQQLHPLVASAALLPDGQGTLRLELGGLTLDALWIEPRTARSPLELELLEAGGEVAGRLRYDADLFEAATAARMVAQLESLLRQAAGDPERPLSDLRLLSREEEELLAGSLSRTAGDYRSPVLLHELFAAQAARSPDSAAAVHGQQTVTFARLAEEADRLASFLVGLDQ
jgi:acyl-CoA synthetase (AMP-forming)/AMP-acid ligase II